MAESNSHVCLFTYKRVVFRSRSISQIEDSVNCQMCDSHVAINYSFMTFAQVDLLIEDCQNKSGRSFTMLGFSWPDTFSLFHSSAAKDLEFSEILIDTTEE